MAKCIKRKAKTQKEVELLLIQGFIIKKKTKKWVELEKVVS
jgi:hypothetical protein